MTTNREGRRDAGRALRAEVPRSAHGDWSADQRTRDPSPLGHEGRRVVAGQRLTQAASDIFLGWAEGPRSGRQYYVRQLWDVKGQGDLTRMDLGKLTHYGALCARVLARAHARTGDPVALAGYLGRGSVFDDAIARFAANHAANNIRDHTALVEALASGRLAARSLS